MGDKQNGGAGLLDGLDAGKTLALKNLVADRERFIDDQHIRRHANGNGKSQPHRHAA